MREKMSKIGSMEPSDSLGSGTGMGQPSRKTQTGGDKTVEVQALNLEQKLINANRKISLMLK